MVQKISFFILNYNGSKILQECVDSFVPALDKNSDIILIDNGSIDNSVDVMKNYKFKRIEIKKNKGFSGGFNEGIKQAKSSSEWYCLVSNDVICLDKKFIARFRQDLKNMKTPGVVGCEFKLPSGIIQKTGGNLKLAGLTQAYLKNADKDGFFKVDMICGALFFIKQDVWNKLKGFDEIFRPYLSEETDLCMRTKRICYNVYKNSNLLFFHKHGQTLKKDDVSFSMFISKRNSAIFKLIHYPLHWIPLSYLMDYKSVLNCFFIRENNGKIKLSKNIIARLKVYFKVHFYILTNLIKIIKKR